MGELTAPAARDDHARRGQRPAVRRNADAAAGVARHAVRVSPPPGYVLFLDEVGERPYRLDRMVTQLRQTGLLARAAAVVVGELPRCDEPSGDPTARAVDGRSVRATFPVRSLIGFPSGHTTGPAMTLPFGVACRVVAGRPVRALVDRGGRRSSE